MDQSSLIEAIAPTPAEVARHVRARTRDALGTELGTFTEETRPTAAGAAAIAAEAARYVAMRLGRPANVTDELVASARDAAALYAALGVEQSYYAEGSQPGSGSGADQLGRSARERIDAVVAEARANGVGGRRLATLVVTSAAASTEADQRLSAHEAQRWQVGWPDGSVGGTR